ncbi:alanine--tRNA ligase-related protein [Spiroplasma culicicola]|uniref:Alanyl-tRNA synthetase n=1 Tax=Spiroplasma culicicola AES-1 TaxID=1276246 RepID=W6A7U5_9MOLU|nr:alanine--tRNA ligase-related protein [Spiroplasma culicicola]AHI52950.1 alanyl-tRNA synthetase [Spiroplasma culicicola AES-1]
MLKNFKGYNVFEITTKITEFLNKVKFTLLYLEETVFFPESAGQVGDLGIIQFNNKDYKILGLTISDDKVVHKTELIEDIEVGSIVTAKIDKNHRDLVSQNHSAAHLLFDTLRELFPTSLGKGYFNDENGLRIDMQLNEKVDWNLILKLNEIVTNKRQTTANKEEIIVDAKTAKEEYNLSIEFNEKELEGDLRIVKFDHVSIQLCSGTHVNNLSEIKDFLIYDFESKGNNIYRFYAKTNEILIKDEYNKLTEKEILEVSNLFDKYAKLKQQFGNDQNIEQALETFLEIKKDTLNFNWDSFLKFKIFINDLKKNMNEYFVQVETKKKDFLFNKYKNIEPNINGETKIFILEENGLENKDYNFICDLILKNNSNSYVEIIDQTSKMFFCKSNGSIKAFERMQEHQTFNIKGGGNEKTAQGKIIERKNSN